jgi:tetratricopeptide (TPR) repeat protein
MGLLRMRFAAVPGNRSISGQIRIAHCASVFVAMWLAGCASTVATGPAPLIPTPAPQAPPAQDSYGLFLSGQQAASEGDLARSAALFDQASLADPDAPFLRARAFSGLLLAGQLDRANAVAATGPVEGDETITGLVILSRATAALGEGRARDAAADLAQTAALGPHSVAAALIRPWALAAAGDWKAATAPSGAGTDKLVVAFSGLGRAQLLEHSGRLGEADAAFKALATSREPAFALAYGAFLERRSRYADAITLYAQALARTPDEPALTAARKRAQTRGTPPAAASLLEGPADPLVNLAALLIGDHQPEIALGYLRLALRLDPSRTDAWVLAGETLAQLGDATGSRAAYLQVKPGRPSYTAARIRLALSFQQVGDRTQALKIVRDALAAAPGDVETEVVYAELLRDAQRHDEAIQVLSGIIARNGGHGVDSRIYYLRGANEERSGKWAEAEADLKHSLRLAPNAPDVLNYLGFAWVDRGEHLKEALDMLQRAVSLAPDSGAIIDSLGWARYRLRDYPGAVRELERAVFLEPGDAEINDHLGDAYWRKGRQAEARYQWRRVLTLNPETRLRSAVEGKLEHGLDPLPPAAQMPAPMSRAPNQKPDQTRPVTRRPSPVA